MTYTNVYKVYKTRVVSLGVLPNSWMSAPLVWSALNKKYFGNPNWISYEPEKMKRLWDLANDPKVDRNWRIVHSMTLDLGIVPPARLLEAAEACQIVHDELGDSPASHWRAIGRALREVAEKPDHRLLGIGLAPTSVSDSWAQIDGKPGEKAWDCVAYALGETKKAVEAETQNV